MTNASKRLANNRRRTMSERKTGTDAGAVRTGEKPTRRRFVETSRALRPFRTRRLFFSRCYCYCRYFFLFFFFNPRRLASFSAIYFFSPLALVVRRKEDVFGFDARDDGRGKLIEAPSDESQTDERVTSISLAPRFRDYYFSTIPVVCVAFVPFVLFVEYKLSHVS